MQAAGKSQSVVFRLSSIEIDQFDQATFTVEISVPSSANNGQSVPISITATPQILSRALLTQ